MNTIDKLIEELCPDGVEWRTLGEVGTFIRGNGLQKKDLIDSGVGAIHYGQLYTHYGTSAKTTISFVSESVASKLRLAQMGDLVIATTSENEEDVCKAVAWLGSQSVAVSGDAVIYRHQMVPKFVSYFFQSNHFRQLKLSKVSGTKVKRVSIAHMSSFPIPLPPLEIQHEIVKILDTFSQLEAELEAELEARRLQYRHYRDELLTFGDEVEYVLLKDVGKWYGGGTPSKANELFWANGTIPWLSPKDMGAPMIDATQDYITLDAIKQSSTRLVPANSVAVVVRSSILDKVLPVALLTIPMSLNQDMKAVSPREDVLPRYVAQMLRSRAADILNHARKTGGSVASIDSEKLMSFPIPIPPLSEQQRIVDILDTFDALVNDLSSGLPAEIAARRQQYEHYRDRLLTFKEKESGLPAV